MAQLRTARMTNDDFISSVDNGLGAAESAIGTIFGIPMDTTIDSPIFGANINAAGELQGIMKWRNTTGLNAGASFIDDSNDSEFRLVASGDELKLYKYNPVGQNPVFKRSLSLEQTFNNLTDNLLGGAGTNKYAGHGGKILAVRLAEDGLEAITPGSAGAITFLDLSDVDDYTNYPNYYLRVRESGGFGVGIEYAQVAAGGVQNYIECLDTPSSFTNDTEGAVRIAGPTAYAAGYKVIHARFYGGEARNQNDQVLNDGTSNMYLDFGSAFREFKAGEVTDIFAGSQINLPYDPYASALYQVSGHVIVSAATLQNAWFKLQLASNNMGDSQPGGIWEFNERRDTDFAGEKMIPFTFSIFIPEGTGYWGTVRMRLWRMNSTFTASLPSGPAITIKEIHTSVYRVK